MNLSVLYRGPLSSCNYGCRYCPFAKRSETAAGRVRDRQALDCFSAWLRREQQHRWKVLFTPWGEALVRARYQNAVASLTHLDHVETVVVQTNLSCNLGWIARCRVERLCLWATYHPTEADADGFVARLLGVRAHGVRVSVGMVGVPDFLDEITAMRRRLPDDVYLWVNAQQPRQRPYSPDELTALQTIDPQFMATARRQPSLGRACRTGEATFTVDGAGDMRRCHFVDEIIGNIANPAWSQALRPRACPNRYCDCFLGKAQLRSDSLEHFFGDTLLERLPTHEYKSLATPTINRAAHLVS